MRTAPLVALVVLAVSCGDDRQIAASPVTSAVTAESAPHSVDVGAAVDHSMPLEHLVYGMIVDDPAGVGAVVRISPGDYSVLFDADSKVGVECMHRAGFDSFPIEVYTPYEVYNAASRPASEGYHVGQANPVGEQTSVVDKWLQQTKGAANAWGGDGVSTGCLAEAATAVYGSPTGLLDGLADFNLARNGWINAVAENPDAIALDSQWSACMKATGFSAADPTEPWRSTWPGDSPAAGEVAMRAADLECRSDLGYSARMTQILGVKFDDWKREHAAVVVSTRASIATWLANAADIAGGP